MTENLGKILEKCMWGILLFTTIELLHRYFYGNLLEFSVASWGLFEIGRTTIFTKVFTTTEKFMKLFMVASEINPFHATSLFRYPLKTSGNLWFSDVFREYQKRLVAWNVFIVFEFFKFFLKQTLKSVS